MSLNFCDLLVVGSDFSGLLAATLLAKRGMNVLLLDDDDESEVLPNLATGLDSRTFKSLLSKLMIPESKIQLLHENKVTCQGGADANLSGLQVPHLAHHQDVRILSQEGA